MLRLRHEGQNVFILDQHGKAVLELDWSAALEVGRALIQLGHQAEAYAKANGIILDHAFMMRAGAPFGMTDNLRMIDAAKSEAGHNRDLRKIIPLTPDERRDDIVPPTVIGGKK